MYIHDAFWEQNSGLGRVLSVCSTKFSCVDQQMRQPFSISVLCEMLFVVYMHGVVSSCLLLSHLNPVFVLSIGMMAVYISAVGGNFLGNRQLKP